MPIRYRIDAERGVIFVDADGKVELADLVAYCRGVVEDPDYRPGLSELADFRRAVRWQIPTADLRQLREVNRELRDRVGSSRLAYVMGDEFGFGLGRMFVAFSFDSEIEHRVFSDMAEAREWLGLPREETDDVEPG